jgi:hypothetical protein
MKQKLTDLRKEINDSAITAGYFNALCSVISQIGKGPKSRCSGGSGVDGRLEVSSCNYINEKS